MFPSTSVGWSGLSCFSLAICGPGAHGCRAGPITRTARTTSRSNSCSTAPLSPWVLPGGGFMEAMGVQKLYEPSPMSIPYVGLAADVLGPVPLMPLFLLGNSTPSLRLSHTSSASTGAPGFHMGWQMQPMSLAGREATCHGTRSTNGCGSLGGANRVWGARRWLRLRSGA